MRIMELDIINTDLKCKLVSAGVDTLSALAGLHTSPRRCLELSQATGLQVGQIRELISAALFCQIKGVDGDYSTLLVKLGVDSVSKLAHSNGEKLFEDMMQFCCLQSQSLPLPSREMLSCWVASAQVIVASEAGVEGGAEEGVLGRGDAAVNNNKQKSA